MDFLISCYKLLTITPIHCRGWQIIWNAPPTSPGTYFLVYPRQWLSYSCHVFFWNSQLFCALFPFYNFFFKDICINITDCKAVARYIFKCAITYQVAMCDSGMCIKFEKNNYISLNKCSNLRLSAWRPHYSNNKEHFFRRTTRLDTRPYFIYYISYCGKLDFFFRLCLCRCYSISYFTRKIYFLNKLN